MKYLVILCSMLLPSADADRDPRPTPARWPSSRDDRIPLPRLGVCPGGFEAWSYDRKHGTICVRRA